MSRALTDAELVALAAVVNSDVAMMSAENEQRAQNGHSLAYTDNWCPDGLAELRAELKRRGVLP